MSFLIVIAALAFLMLVAYRGYSVAPVAALGAVLLIDPSAVAPIFSGIYMEKLVGFVKLYFPVFLLGAVFGKVIELSGFSESIVAAAIKYIGRSRANAVIVAVCALLTYGGVSLFVVVFAVYPFAAELYRQSNIPKRLMPGAIALGAFSFTMDARCPARRRSEHHPHHVLQDHRLGRAGAGRDRRDLHHRRGPDLPGMAPQERRGPWRRLRHLAAERARARRHHRSAQPDPGDLAADPGRRGQLRADPADPAMVRRPVHGRPR